MEPLERSQRNPGSLWKLLFTVYIKSKEMMDHNGSGKEDPGTQLLSEYGSHWETDLDSDWQEVWCSWAARGSSDKKSLKRWGMGGVELMSDLEIVDRNESSSGHTSTPLVAGI